MEGGLCSPCGNFGVNPLDITLDHMSAKGYISSSIIGPMAFVSGHDKTDPLLNLSSCNNSFEFRQKRKQSEIFQSSASVENAVDQDKGCVPDAWISGKSCSDSAIIDKRSQEILLQQNNFVYKRRKVKHSLTLNSGHSHTAFAKESWQSTEANHKRYGKNCTAWPKTLHTDNNKDILETDVNDRVFDKRTVANCQMSNSEKDGSILENEVMCKWHDKSDISDSQPSNCLLQTGKTTKTSSSNRELNGNCFGNLSEYNLPCGNSISRSQSESSSFLCDSEGEVRIHEIFVDVTCKSRSDSQNFTNLSTEGGPFLGESAYKLNVDNTQDENSVAGAFGCCVPDATGVAEERDHEREWCISILKESKLLDLLPGKSAAIEHPGFVGDGRWNKRCKVCDALEDSTSTLICDMCEESFHMSCCNPKVVSIPVKDNWYCTTCRKKRNRPVIKPSIGSREKRHGINFQSRAPYKSFHEKIGKEFWRMLQDAEPYTTQVRIGKDYQADVPIWTGEVMDFTEIVFMGELVSSAEKLLELKLSEHNLRNDIWPKDWKPAKFLTPGSRENWIQCQNVLYSEGEVCPDGRKAKKDIICGKWRRAPLSQVQDDEWDCSCAVVWDPFHADCAVAQELKTEDILERLKASEMVSEIQVE